MAYMVYILQVSNWWVATDWGKYWVG